MKNNTGKQTEKQEIYQFPQGAAEYLRLHEGKQISYISVDDNDRYEHLGINPYDILVLRLATEYNENQVSVWQVAREECFRIGFAFDNFGDISIHDGDDDFERYKKKNIKLVGVIVGVIKPFKIETKEAAPEESKEITVTCSECSKQDEGSQGFLKGEGWKLKGKQLCLSCDLF